MKKILYIHGFSSAGSTGTATLMRNMLYDKDVRVVSPDVPVLPLEALQFLKDYAAQEQPDLIIGTSMGGMYAEQLRGYKRILVNPSFHMARLLTFRGLGNYDFQNKRADGATRFKVDKQMIAEFKEVEKLSFKGLTPEDKKNVYGLFGRNDPTVHTQDDYTKIYGKEHFVVFEGEHRLNDKVLKHDVLPIIMEILGL
ncbi:MAG: alpha/beta hydrolase family protein [Bacteroidales bacterium]|nr:alpha/beta hydrolase family protein [Bacteroidales bacterium]